MMTPPRRTHQSSLGRLPETGGGASDLTSWMARFDVSASWARCLRNPSSAVLFF
jgi:hypothetical protein